VDNPVSLFRSCTRPEKRRGEGPRVPCSLPKIQSRRYPTQGVGRPVKSDVQNSFATSEDGVDVVKRDAAILLRHPEEPPKIRDLKRWRQSGANARDLVRHVEANLPTQQPPSQAQARFPRPHEDARRAFDSQEPPGQGSRAALGLGAPRRAPMRTARSLPSSRDFRRVLDQGRRARSGGIEAVLAPNDEAQAPARLGLAVQSSGGAVARNRIKRRLRGAYGRIDAPAGYDIVVRAGDRARAGEFARLVSDLEAAVTKAHRGGAE
jgi:ribonuclease P protein component